MGFRACFRLHRQVLFHLARQIIITILGLTRRKDQATGSTAAVDFDGQIRPYNSVSDLGAFEYWPFTLNAIRGNGTVQLSWTTGAGFLLTGGLSNYEVVVTCATGASAPCKAAAECRSTPELVLLSR